MKSRLKKISNHVDPIIHNVVEDIVVNHSFDNTNENQSEAFLLTKQLFASTPFTSTGSLSYQFSKKIENGEYNHISSIEDAQDHWAEWLYALNEFLNEQNNTVLASNLKKK